MNDDIIRFTWNQQSEPAAVEHMHVGAEHSGPGLLVTVGSNVRAPSSSMSWEIDAETHIGWSMQKRKRGHVIDKLNLNSCLCGSVVNPSTEGSVKCKQSSCEMQWVSTFGMTDKFPQLTPPSII